MDRHAINLGTRRGPELFMNLIYGNALIKLIAVHPGEKGSKNYLEAYRVTDQVILQVLLTQEQKLCLSERSLV